ncbi:MAG: hypothetical protein KDB80_15160 [Planctomycetes bacterium]|nr:hypothetical protein [Planctomycetota bacterium]
MHARASTNESGFSLAELMIGIVVFIVSVVVLGSHITSSYTSVQSQRDTVFAYTKAQAILSEVHSFVDSGAVEAAVDLDVLDDGIQLDPVLTVSTAADGSELAADHPLSGNVQRDGDWVWSRQISVRPFAALNNRNVRYVTIRIFKKDANGIDHEAASLSSVVNSVASSYPTTQVFDVYLLAIDSIPGWWVHMESIIPFVESAITDLENRNPGLSVRTHWITKSGYGRDQAYRPFTNETNDSYTQCDNVYYYPGKMPSGSASSYYYVPDLMRARMLVDGVERHGYDATTNPYPYAMADFYNHCMRYPQAKEFHDLRLGEVAARKAAILAAEVAGTTPPAELEDMSEEPTLQILLEEMISNPDDYRHALLVNLHGELLPTPPLRNYSDAAKSPSRFPGVRVVTHPEQLRAGRPGTAGEEDVRLRVYAYKTDPSSGVERVPAVGAGLDSGIYIEVMDVNLTDFTQANGLHPDCKILKLDGGISGAAYDTDFVQAKYVGEAPAAGEMHYYVWFNNPYGKRKYTSIFLVNTPTICTEVGGQGIRNNEQSRLYDLEYIPSCADTDATPDFSNNLGDVGNGPKNTARWVIEIGKDIWADQRFYMEVEPAAPATVNYDPNDTAEPDHALVVRTRLADLTSVNWSTTGKWFTPSTTPVEPENFSETYCWWADSPDDVPFTERSQFQGDPRHNPYLDTLDGDPDFPSGYNWFFDSLTNDSENSRNDYYGIARTWNRWNSALRQDAPRLFELFRKAISSTRSIYTTLTGYSYYYMGVGNEIGYDGANGYPSSIPTSRKPWGSGTSSTGYVNNITGSRCYVREGGSNYWWGMPWLGELCPDSQYSYFYGTDTDGNVRGNLMTGTSSGEFYRYTDYDCYRNSNNSAYGTRMYASQHCTSTRGCVSFFNNGTSSAHFNHHFSGGSGYPVGPGLEIADNYGFPMPSSVEVSRPFSVNTGGNGPTEYGYAPYSTSRFNAQIVRTFFNHPSSGYTGSGLVELEDPIGGDAGYIVVNGIAQTTTIGTSFIAKYCLLSMYQSFFETGDTGMTYRIKQPARVEILSPTEISEINNPTSIDIQFSAEWTRWDGQPYTGSTSGSFAEAEGELEYVIMYSPDIGTTWRYIQNDAVAVPGTKPTDASVIVADAGAGDETVNWSVPAGSFPEGSYLIRVECYRQNQALHYSQHQSKIYIER